jgi:hypothetical protein
VEASSNVLWKRQDLPGHEACRVLPLDTGWQLAGVAVLAYEGQPCRLDYLIDCDPRWVTQSAAVTGWVGEQTISATVVRDGAGLWQLNGRAVDGVAGCIDIDLNFSPSTNLLPIRRLNLAIGAKALVRAAWLRFPSFALELLDQSYTRLESRRYRYESAGGRFVTEVTVDDAGLVIDYGDIWSREAPA